MAWLSNTSLLWLELHSGSSGQMKRASSGHCNNIVGRQSHVNHCKFAWTSIVVFLIGWLHRGAHSLKRLPPRVQPYHAALPQSSIMRVLTNIDLACLKSTPAHLRFLSPQGLPCQPFTLVGASPANLSHWLVLHLLTFRTGWCYTCQHFALVGATPANIS